MGAPPRPGIPVLRHLTWTELHSAEIGAGVAAIVYWGQYIGLQKVAFFVGLFGIVVALTGLGEMGGCDHKLGVHDIREEPPYFIVSGILFWSLLAVLWGVPL